MSLTIVMALSLGVRALSAGPEGSGRRALLRGLALGALSAGAALGGVGLGLVTRPGAFRGVLVFAALCYIGGRMLLEAVRAPEEQEPLSRRALLGGTAADALLAGLSVPYLPVPLWGTVGAVGGGVLLMGTLGALLPQRILTRVLPWLSALGGLALTWVGMRTLLGALP